MDTYLGITGKNKYLTRASIKKKNVLVVLVFSFVSYRGQSSTPKQAMCKCRYPKCTDIGTRLIIKGKLVMFQMKRGVSPLHNQRE